MSLILGCAPLAIGAFEIASGNIEGGVAPFLGGLSLVQLSDKTRIIFENIHQAIEEKQHPPRIVPFMAGVLSTSVPIVSTALYAVSLTQGPS